MAERRAAERRLRARQAAHWSWLTAPAGELPAAFGVAGDVETKRRLREGLPSRGRREAAQTWAAEAMAFVRRPSGGTFEPHALAEYMEIHPSTERRRRRDAQRAGLVSYGPAPRWPRRGMRARVAVTFQLARGPAFQRQRQAEADRLEQLRDGAVDRRQAAAEKRLRKGRERPGPAVRLQPARPLEERIAEGSAPVTWADLEQEAASLREPELRKSLERLAAARSRRNGRSPPD